MNRRIAALAVCMFVVATVASPAQTRVPVKPAGKDLPVDLELILAVDVSRSMDESELALQRQGYIAALHDPQVIQAIRSGAYGRIAIAYVEWAGPQSQAIVVPWTLIEDEESAEAVAAQIVPGEIIGRRGTSISAGLAFAAAMFDGNGYAGDHRTIDISGDGANNNGPPVVPVRDAVVARGITINGLPIVLHPGGGAFGEFDIAGLDQYYRDCVTGGPGSFTIPVTAVDQFEAAIRRKLILEISWAANPVLPVAETAAETVAATPATDCLIGEKTRPAWLR